MSDPAKVRKRIKPNEEESPFDLIKRIASDDTLWPAKGSPQGIQTIRKIIVDKNIKPDEKKVELIAAKAETEIANESNAHRVGLFGRRNPNENSESTKTAVKFYHAIVKAHALGDIGGLKELKDSIIVNKHFKRRGV